MRRKSSIPSFQTPSKVTTLWRHELSAEVLESRIVLSAQPVWEMLASLQPEPESLQDLDWQVASNPIPPTIQPMLNEAHSQTGWTTVQKQFGLHGQGQTVAVIDSGIAYDHHALGRGLGQDYRVVGGWDFAENDANPYDDGPAGFHGTHVAGIIGAQGRENGVATEVDFVALRVFNDVGKGNLAWTEQALQWVHKNRHAFENPITTVNLSLGTQWNSMEVPTWATLEDELRQLYEDGIVVVASAGNSFQQYNAPGLSYPAASPYVIPVASVDANGAMSQFSQRSDRVIAAPGRSILSTVPDHLLGRDGIINDWSVATGTSMAAPYVSGAAVLLREAMQIAGWERIDSQSIYQAMQDYADSIWDSVTSSHYDRLNLQRAIDAILPDDQVGADWSSAQAITMVDGALTTGWINTLGDRDSYRFTSSIQGEVQLQLRSDALDALQWTLWEDGILKTSGLGSDFDFQVRAGHQYAIGFASSEDIGKFEIDWDVKASQDYNTQTAEQLGRIESLDKTSVAGRHFAAEASHDGLFSILVDASQEGVGTLRARSGSSGWISDTTWENGWLRLDLQVQAGDKLEWTIADISKVDEMKLLNLIQVNGDHVRIHESRDSLNHTIRLGTTTQIAIDGVEYVFGSGSIKQVTMNGGNGSDGLEIWGSRQIERVEVRPDFFSLTSNSISIQATSFERVEFQGGGGADRVIMSDGAGDDVLISRPRYAELSSAGYRFVVEDVERINVSATQGGQDLAYLHDSRGDDIFTIRPQFSSMRGDGFFNYLTGFERTFAYADAGGKDFAQLYDSVANDRFQTSGDAASIVGDNYFGYTRYFERVEAYATAGGHDVATFYSDSKAKLARGADFSSFENGEQYRIARGFEQFQNSIDGKMMPSNLQRLGEAEESPSSLLSGQETAHSEGMAANAIQRPLPYEIDSGNPLTAIETRGEISSPFSNAWANQNLHASSLNPGWLTLQPTGSSLVDGSLSQPSETVLSQVNLLQEWVASELEQDWKLLQDPSLELRVRLALFAEHEVGPVFQD